MPASHAPPAPATGTATGPDAASTPSPSRTPDGAARPPRRSRLSAPARHTRFASLLGAGIGGVVYFLTLLDYRPDVLRGATSWRYAETFFDLQATALMKGHLAVPTGSLGIEGFVVDGRTYSYFGIFPALLRIPVQLVTHEYDGRLTLFSMAIAWVVLAVMTTRLYWLVGRCLRPGREVGRLDAVVAVIVLAAVTGGTSITYDASLPWAYHEVYLWSVASVIGSLYWLLRCLVEPSPRDVRWLFVLVLIASLTRTTGGWAVCLTTLAAAFWVWRRRTSTGNESGSVSGTSSVSARGLLVAGLVPLLVAIGINYLKFRHPYMFPLQDQVFTKLNAHRREILAENGGTLAGLQFFPSALLNYFRLDGIRFTDYYPWVTFPATPAHGYGRELDQGYRTGGIPVFMPLLFLLTLASVPLLARRLRTFEQRAVRLVFAGAVLMTGGVMAYGYIAYRYTSEFVPALALGGMVTAHWSVGLLARLRPPAARTILTAAAVLAAYSLAVHALVGHATAASTYRGSRLEAFIGRQVDVSGGSAGFSRLVHHSESLPSSGHADDLWIVGDCDALYVNTGGDDRVPWVLVEQRDTATDVDLGPDARAGTYPLMRQSRNADRVLSLRITPYKQAQLVLDDDGLVSEGQLFDLPPQAHIRVGARNMSEFNAAELSSTPGGIVGFLPTSEFDPAGRSVLSTVVAVPQSGGVPGVSIRPASTLPLGLCRRVAAAAHVDLAAPTG